MKYISRYSAFLESTDKESRQFAYHTSNPMFRDSIDRDGLIPQGKSENWLEGTEIEGKAIFATLSENPSYWVNWGYDDDVWKIDLSKIDNVWHLDPNYGGSERYIWTAEPISREAIELVHRGTGEVFY